MAKRCRLVAQMAGVSAALLGAAALVGWLFHNEALKCIVPGSAPLKPNIATGFLVCGGALALLSRTKVERVLRYLIGTAALVVIALAAVTLGENFFDWDFAIDHWLVGEISAAAGISQAGRMLPSTALCFFLMGSALFMASDLVAVRLRSPITAGLGAAPALIGLLALTGFCLEMLLGPAWNLMGMNVSGITASVGFLLLGSGLLALLQSKRSLPWSLNTLTTAGFAIGILLMVMAAAVSFSFARQLQQTATNVSHSQEVLKKIEEVRANMANLESGQRGYIITGDQHLLEGRKQQEGVIKQDITDLRKLIAGEADQTRRRLDQVESLADQRLDWENKTILARAQHSFAAAQELISSGIGMELSKTSQQLLRAMEKREYDLLDSWQKQSNVASRRTFILLPMGMLLSLTMLLLGLFFLNAGVIERWQAEQARRQAEAKYRNIVENAVEGIFQSTPEGRFISANPALARIFGYDSPKELISSCIDLVRQHYVDPQRREEFKRSVEQNGSVRGFELEVYRKDGSRIWLSENVRTVRDANGVVLYYEGTSEDVTMRKRAEEESRLLQKNALGISEAKDFDEALGIVLRNVCEVTGWILGQAWIPRPDERVLECGAAWSREGANVEKFQTLSRSLTLPPGIGLCGRVWASKQVAWIDDVTTDTNFPHAHAARESGLKAAVGIPVMANDEVVAVVEFLVRQARAEDERFVKLISSVVAQLGQIVQRKHLEASLRQAEQKYRAIFENAVEGIFQTTPEGKYIGVNPALARIYGYGSPEELMATVRDIGQVVYVNPARRVEFKHLIETQGFVARFEYEVFRKDDRRIWLSENARAVRDPIGEVVYYEGTVEDITERKQAEEALRASEAHLRTVVENLDEGVVVSDLKGQLLHWNRAALDIHGFSDVKEGLRSLSDLVDTFELADMKGTPVPVKKWPLSRILRGEHLHDVELRVRNIKAGSVRIFNYGGTLVHDARHQPLMAVVTVSDITERKRSEERLFEQADIINRAQDAIIIRNYKDENITFWNAAAERLYGWSAREALGKAIGELIFADQKERESPLKQLVSTGEFRGEVKQLTKDNRAIIVDCRATLIRNVDGVPRSVLLINTDVTEQKKLEMQLLRAQRLESIGTLASGVAHDLNNILSPILMCAHTLRRDLTEADRRATISMIEESAQRGAGVVKQILTFAGGIEGERILIKPSYLIEEMVGVARTTFPKSIETVGRYPENLWNIQGEPTQLHQVLLNLSVNARDAMPSGGTLTLAAENFTVDEHYAAMTPDAKVGPYVTLRVSDTGTGIPRATIDKIFDPFFTTKEVGKGTGLGLSTALGILKSHGGFLSIYSEVGKGTTFKIFLPATMSGEELQKSKTAVTPARGNGEQILVVDDEPNILRITKTIFEQYNYRVLSAGDGPEALALFAQQMGSIGGVLTDIAMPYMDGVALVRALRKMKSDIPIIASTGQVDQSSMAELQSLGVKHFLAKPYNTEQLLATVRETLQGRESPV